MTPRSDAQTEQARSDFANEAEVERNDRVLLETPGGTSAEKERGERSLVDAEVAGISTAKPADDGTATDDETADGLTSSEESMRQAAEDAPTGAPSRTAEQPVFDRGDAPPRI